MISPPETVNTKAKQNATSPYQSDLSFAEKAKASKIAHCAVDKHLDARALTAIDDEVAARDPCSSIRHEKSNKLGNIRWNACATQRDSGNNG